MARIVVNNPSVVAAFSADPLFQPLLLTLATMSTDPGWPSVDGMHTSPQITDYNMFTRDTLLGLLASATAKGYTVGEHIDVIEYPSFVALTAAQLEMSVPDYMFPNGKPTDESDVEIDVKWKDYHGYTTVDNWMTVADPSVDVGERHQMELDYQGIHPITGEHISALVAAGYDVQNKKDWQSNPEAEE